jgi:hypothetical protein
MVRRLVYWAGRWNVTLGALLAVVLWWAASVLPPSSFWFVARSMVVPDSVVGSDTVLLVDREIRRPVYGDWTVTVRKHVGDGWVLHCVATGGSDYSPLASLPDPLTLDWWTLDQCQDLTAGTYFITTTWAFRPPWLPGYRRSPPLVSNAFRVMEIAE